MARPRRPRTDAIAKANGSGKSGLLQGYSPNGFFCEMLRTAETGDAAIQGLQTRLNALSVEELRHIAHQAEADLLARGVTFTVYSEALAIDRILPFDLIPRLITAAEWAHIESGVAQRVRAINEFLHDVYHDQHILRDGVVPTALVLDNPCYTPQMAGFHVPHRSYVQVCGIDIVRGGDGRFQVLEDNARTPSGVSYVLENRRMSHHLLPGLIDQMPIRPVDDYGRKLRNALTAIAPETVLDPGIVLLSPGVYNSAYFEHVFLAREMGVPLVEGRDLVVENDRVFMRTLRGLSPVHTIYRRINDSFLDPTVFNPESALGVPGLFQAWRRGHVALANAIGTGIADDKAIYAYMPRIIRYYLQEEPILASVETHLCGEAEGLRYTLSNLDKLVVKPVGESGGYGLMIGPHASAAEREDCRKKLHADPGNYISQPMLDLSVAPTLTDTGVAGRHVDLRPFAITGRDTWVLPGGLTRVALREGQLVVNSSQGGGTKDTWVLCDEPDA